MNVFQIFLISLYVQICTSSLMLVYAEEAAFSPGMLTPLVAIVTFWYVEHKKTFSFSTGLAGSLGILALILAWGELFSGDIEARLLAGAHILVYLCWIVLFQKKERSQCWLIIALGLLQVAVGSVLTEQAVYGLLLLIFLMLSLWTLSLFSIYQMQEHFAEASHSSEPQIATRTAVKEGTRPFHQESLALHSSHGHEAILTRGNVQRDPDEKWISWRFVGGYLGTTSLAIFIALVFYLLIPRFWIGKQNLLDEDDSFSAVAAKTGFSSSVSLGEIGEILESTELALRLRLVDSNSQESLSVSDYASRLGYEEPLFRGSVLDTYQNGQWKSSALSRGFLRMGSIPSYFHQVVVQEISLQPMGTNVIFAMQPVIACRMYDERKIPRIHYLTGQMQIKNPSRKIQHYQIFSRKPTGNEVTLPHVMYRSRVIGGTSLQRYLQLPETGLVRLKELATSIAGTVGNETVSERDKAMRIVEYLRDSGEYGYTLDLSIQDPTIDPVEDFLFNRKVGHCEYYATALALMLRANNIPSRMVNGFKGGIEESDGSFQVQQRHAHAWVEAYIERNWVTLDATPSALRSASIASFDKEGFSWDRFKASFTNFWSKSIIGLDFKEQRRRFYEPLKELFVTWWNQLKNHQWGVRDLWHALWNFLTSPEKWFSLSGGIFTFLFLTTLLCCYWVLKKIARLLHYLPHRFGRRSRPQRKLVEFYERFAKVCQAQGWTRLPAQTQLEFVSHVKRQASLRLSESGMEQFPSELVQAFYAVRFGNHQLSTEQIQHIDAQLHQWEQLWEQS